jgi:hypothetical protein
MAEDKDEKPSLIAYSESGFGFPAGVVKIGEDVRYVNCEPGQLLKPGQKITATFRLTFE